MTGGKCLGDNNECPEWEMSGVADVRGGKCPGWQMSGVVNNRDGEVFGVTMKVS